MNIKEILTQNGYENQLSLISEKILDFDTGVCNQIRPIPQTIDKLFDGFEIYSNEDKNKIIIINTEHNTDDEFLPLYVQYLGNDGYITVEIFYDNDLNVAYVNDVR